MTAAAALAFPGGRTLAGWWRQLAPWQPRNLWVGHLLLHRVEALVRLTRQMPLASLDHSLLQAMRVVRVPTAQALDECLRLGRQVLGQLLGQLGKSGLAEHNSAGHWTPTVLGGAALTTGHYAATSHERRAFYFRESEQRGCLPSFLPLSHPAMTPWPVGEDWEFDVSLLQACVAQSPEWKERRGFPSEVDEVCLTSVPGEASEPWRQVVVHRPERFFTLLALVPSDAGGERILGFAIQQDGWVLNTKAPAFALGSSWPESFPELADDLPLEEWRLAWRSWCQPRGLVEAASDAFPLERAGHRLRVVAPARFLDKLRAARSDALKGEAWVLARGSRIRAAALIEIVEAAQGQGNRQGI